MSLKIFPALEESEEEMSCQCSDWWTHYPDAVKRMSYAMFWFWAFLFHGAEKHLGDDI